MSILRVHQNTLTPFGVNLQRATGHPSYAHETLPFVQETAGTLLLLGTYLPHPHCAAEPELLHGHRVSTGADVSCYGQVNMEEVSPTVPIPYRQGYLRMDPGGAAIPHLCDSFLR